MAVFSFPKVIRLFDFGQKKCPNSKSQKTLALFLCKKAPQTIMV
uniref:Uncharacterized protein n=1 Tax=viral metagenome TaxID=1070528 RepID=A0A6C0KXI7_9ZZZZ